MSKVLLFDLEISPIIGYAYKRWEANLIDVDHEQHIQSFSYKWLGEKKVYCFAQPDFPQWKKDRFDDSALAQKLNEVLSQAEIVVAHNLKKFDAKQANTSFIRNDISPPRPYKTIDTLQVAKKYFKFSSNSLNELGKQLKVGQKLEKGVPQLWKLCMNGDKKAWGFMKAYNKQDVLLLEKIYLKLRPWIESYPVTHLDNGTCRKCGSNHLIKRGFVYRVKGTAHKLQCRSCGSWTQSDFKKDIWDIKQ